MMINIKSSTCEEEELTKNRHLAVEKFGFGKTSTVINIWVQYSTTSNRCHQQA